MKRSRTIVAVLSLLFVGALAWAADDKKAHHNSAELEPPKYAVAVLVPTKGNKVEGTIQFTADKSGTRIQGRVMGLTPGKHGFHIHEFGDLRTGDGESAGSYFNPDNKKHGGLDSDSHHAGDLGNIEADEQGKAEVDIEAHGLMLHFAFGRSIVVHAKADDLKTQPSGDSGPRVAVGVIGIANPKHNSAEKTASISR